jgi:hypothetical protein
MKPRLLITISSSLAIKYIFRTTLFIKIAEFAEPVIAIGWEEELLIEELKAARIEYCIIPKTSASNNYIKAKQNAALWFENKHLKSPSIKIQETLINKHKNQQTVIKNKAKKIISYLKLLFPGYQKRVLNEEARHLITDTNFTEISKFIDKLNLTAVFTITPFHHLEDLLLRVCKSKSMLMITSIHSFDNITKYAWVPVVYDVYMLWNRYMLDQLFRIYPQTKNKQVHITGAPQFDFYYNDAFLYSKIYWQQMMGITDTSKKVILYAGGSALLFPRESQYVQHIINAIENGDIPGNPILIIRCHPLDTMDRWQSTAIRSAQVIFDAPWTGEKIQKHTNLTTADIKKLCATLAYTDIHINLCSTMTLDGSAFNKPQIGPAYDEVLPAASKTLKKMYYQEHYEPIMKHKVVQLANSKKEMITLIINMLNGPEPYITNCKSALDDLISYTDGNSALRVAAILKGALQKEKYLTKALYENCNSN